MLQGILLGAGHIRRNPIRLPSADITRFRVSARSRFLSRGLARVASARQLRQLISLLPIEKKAEAKAIVGGFGEVHQTSDPLGAEAEVA